MIVPPPTALCSINDLSSDNVNKLAVRVYLNPLEASLVMEKPLRAGSNPRLVDTHSRQVYPLQPGRQIVGQFACSIREI